MEAKGGTNNPPTPHLPRSTFAHSLVGSSLGSPKAFDLLDGLLRPLLVDVDADDSGAERRVLERQLPPNSMSCSSDLTEMRNKNIR